MKKLVIAFFVTCMLLAGILTLHTSQVVHAATVNISTNERSFVSVGCQNLYRLENDLNKEYYSYYPATRYYNQDPAIQDAAAAIKILMNVFQGYNWYPLYYEVLSGYMNQLKNAINTVYSLAYAYHC